MVFETSACQKSTALESRNFLVTTKIARKSLLLKSEGCDSETKSVEGDEGKDSVWSSIHPPASSSKRSNGARLCHIILFVTSIAAVLPKEILEAGPEGCDSETKSVEGDDEQDSVRSSIHPPASSSKMSNRTRLCHIVSNLLCENQDCKIQ